MSKYPNDDLFESTKMSFGEHLEELRVCLIRSLMALAIGCLVGMYFGAWVVDFIQKPLRDAMENHFVGRAIEDLAIQYKGLPSPEIQDFIRKTHAIPEIAYVEIAELKRISEATGEFTLPPEPTEEEQKKLNEQTKDTAAKESEASDKPKDDQTKAAESGKIGNEKTLDPKRVNVLGGEMPGPRPFLAKTRIWRPMKAAITSLSADEAFMIWMKAGFVFGAILSSPWIFYYIWDFVAAGLYPHEKKYVHIYLPLSIGLFLAGAALAFFFVFEPVLSFLFSFNKSMNIGIDARISEWLGFVLLLPLGFGLSFQLPLVMLFLNRIGVISLKLYLENWRIAILAVFVISMVLTPADPVSMLLMAGPLSVLYFLGIGLCKWMPKGKSPFAEFVDEPA